MSQKTSDRQRLLRQASTQKSNIRKRSMFKLVRWGWIAGTTSVMSLMVGVMPALAAELAAWNYDTETRSLNITLPATTKPTLSVTADDQLLVKLPDTQVGKAIGQTVFDGVVESIVLEQATPETVWMVVDFAPGTILASAQSATSIVSSGSDSNGMRQWQVRPELMATRRVADAIASLSSESTLSADAAALSSEPDASAQPLPAADFPDLPILEPAIPIAAPIVVPPITARAPEPVRPAPLPPIAVRQPPRPEPVSVPTIIEADAVENEPVVAILEPDVPAALPPINDMPVAKIEATAPIVTAPTAAAPTAAAPIATAPIATAPIATAPTAIVIPEIDLSGNGSSIPTNSRWPDPIPFGQPLP